MEQFSRKFTYNVRLSSRKTPEKHNQKIRPYNSFSQWELRIVFLYLKCFYEKIEGVT